MQLSPHPSPQNSFHLTEPKFYAHWTVTPQCAPAAPGSQHPISVSMTLAHLAPHIQYFSFWVVVILLNVVFVRSSQVAVCQMSSFLKLSNSHGWLSAFVYSSPCDMLTVTSAPWLLWRMSLCETRCQWPGNAAGSGIVGWYGTWFLIFLKNFFILMITSFDALKPSILV